MNKFADIPRNKFADPEPEAIATPQDEHGTVAWVIERFIKEIDATARPLGDTHRITLRKMQKLSIAKKDAASLDNGAIIEWAQELVLGVQPCTVNHYLVILAGALRYAGSNPKWKCPKINDACVKAARPFLKAHGIIAKSEPRTRRPQKEEKVQLHARFDEQNKNPNCFTDMVRVSRWQQASSRRIGESCALLWRDWSPDDQTIIVRKMKDPKVRNKMKVVALPWDAQELLYEWAYKMDAKPELRTDEPRILPYNSKTCSQRYTKAKKRLNIENLHLHDDRRDRSSRLIEEDGYSADEATAFTGHESTKVFEHNYKHLNPALVAKGPAAKRNGVTR